jgi:bilirubin oxidase
MNCFRGLTGTYIIYDPAEDALNLPTGKYDVPLMMTDKMYTDSGDLVSVGGESEDFVGDIMEVNGQPWPYLEVEPRKYRLRLYNTATSRPLDLHVEQSNGDWLDFQVIASDSGLFGSPVNSNDVTIAMGERYEIVVDFSSFANQNLTLKNAFALRGPGYPEYANMDLVMSFVVGGSVSDWSSNDVPSTLNPNIEWPQDKDEVDHTFRFQRGGGTCIMILTLKKPVLTFPRQCMDYQRC